MLPMEDVLIVHSDSELVFCRFSSDLTIILKGNVVCYHSSSSNNWRSYSRLRHADLSVTSRHIFICFLRSCCSLNFVDSLYSISEFQAASYQNYSRETCKLGYLPGSCVVLLEKRIGNPFLVIRSAIPSMFFAIAGANAKALAIT